MSRRLQAVLDEINRATTLAPILSTNREPIFAAIQLDYDATRSQRPFYRALVNDLRLALPPKLPLPITALASWRSHDDWLGNLTIDEAVPMFFRMEADCRRASPNHDVFLSRKHAGGCGRQTPHSPPVACRLRSVWAPTPHNPGRHRKKSPDSWSA